MSLIRSKSKKNTFILLCVLYSLNSFAIEEICVDILVDRKVLHERVIDFSLRENGELPKNPEQWNNVLGINNKRFFGRAEYQDGKRLETKRVHNSTISAYENLLHDAQEKLKITNLENPSQASTLRTLVENIQDKIESLKLDSMSTSDKQKTLHNRVINFALNNDGRLPSGDKQWSDVLKTANPRYFGIGNYREGYTNGKERVHNSTQDAFEGLLKEAESKEVSPQDQENLTTLIKNIKNRLHSRTASSDFEALPLEDKKNLLTQKTLSFALKQEGRLPSGNQEWKDTLEFVYYNRFLGVGDHREGTPLRANAIYPSPLSFYKDLLDVTQEKIKEAKSKNDNGSALTLEILKENIEKKLQLTQNRLSNKNHTQEDILSTFLESALENDGKLATIGDIAKVFSISQSRITGTGNYMRGARQEHKALFKSKKAFYENLQSFAQEKLNEAKESGNSAEAAKLEKVLEAIRKKIPLR